MTTRKRPDETIWEYRHRLRQDFGLITMREVTRLVQLTDRGLRNLIEDGEFPPPRRYGKWRLWHPDDLEKHYQERTLYVKPEGVFKGYVER